MAGRHTRGGLKAASRVWPHRSAQIGVASFIAVEDETVNSDDESTLALYWPAAGSPAILPFPSRNIRSESYNP
jgi:hypothetical protein